MAKNNSKTTKSQSAKRVGDIGERITVKYLKQQGFTVIETNYRKTWGELDIVAQNKHIIHFIEVKTHSFSSIEELYKRLGGENWRPEEQVHEFKMRQITRTLETWLVEHDWEGEFQIDVVAVRVVPDERYATVNHIENIVN